MFIVDYYKYTIANQPSLFNMLPQPPTSGDFSDESLMKEFGLTENQMKHIHNKMNDYGWKTRELVKDHKESSLLQFIDDLNNGKAKLPESKKGKKNTPVEPDSSPSTSETLPKSIYDLELRRLDPNPEIPEDEKYKEEDLKNAYPDKYERFEKDGEDYSFRYWLYKELDK